MNEDELKDLYNLDENSVDSNDNKSLRKPSKFNSLLDSYDSLTDKISVNYRKLKSKLGIKFWVISALVFVITLVVLNLYKSGIILDFMAKRYSNQLVKVNSIERVDNILNISIDGETISIALGDDKLGEFKYNSNLKVYKSLDSGVSKSSVFDLLAANEDNDIACYINKKGTLLVYSYYNSDPNIEGSSIINGLESSCRFIKIDNGYLIDIYNPNYNKYKEGDLLFFNSEGDIDSVYSRGFDYYVEKYNEYYQVTVPSDCQVEVICENIMKTLDSSFVEDKGTNFIKDSIKLDIFD